MAKALKSRASKQGYVSQRQLTLTGFETPFSKELNPNNRWIILAHKIPWDALVSVYQSQMQNDKTGADGINPRVAIGAMIIKHTCNLSDRETVLQIQENMYMQYFIGYSSFSDEEPFDPSLFVEFRKRLGIEQINTINEKILGLYKEKNQSEGLLAEQQGTSIEKNREVKVEEQTAQGEVGASTNVVTHQGKLIVDATACPQDISYPTDLNLLNDAREKSEELIDVLYNSITHAAKPRTYREQARKNYLRTAQKKIKSKKEIRKAIRKQLSYLKRNIKNIHKLLDSYEKIPLNRHQYKYLLVIQTLYEQQSNMYQQKTHSIEHRIVSIHQPHVRPIVRGKTNASVEFGAKIQVSLMNGFAFLEELSWEAFNEGKHLMKVVDQYKARLGYYPQEILVDRIYCNRENRTNLKQLGIMLRAKPLGRPKAVDVEHVRPGERNPIEGKFGQAKTAYGMNRIKARLQSTSQSWIATIVMVLNLVKLTGLIPYCLIVKWVTTYSAILLNKIIGSTNKEIREWDGNWIEKKISLT
jgi:hypothetical protein